MVEEAHRANCASAQRSPVVRQDRRLALRQGIGPAIMIVDSSAIIAILRDEPERSTFETILDAAKSLQISAATYLELAIVIDSRRDPAISREIDDFLDRFDIQIEPVTA